MDHLNFWTRDAADGFTELVIEGDVQAFGWLIAAAGNARDGFLGNQADATTGDPARIVLQPLVPNSKADQAPRSRTAHLRHQHRPAEEVAKIMVAQSDYDAIPDKIKAELYSRGTRFAIYADAPELEPPAEETADPTAVAAGVTTPPSPPPQG